MKIIINKLSEKCNKDIIKFCEWAQHEYNIEDMDGEKCRWAINMISYEEPSRNKIEKFVEKVLGMYNVMDNDSNSIEDYKSLVAEYKNIKKTKTTKKKKGTKDMEEEQTGTEQTGTEQTGTEPEQTETYKISDIVDWTIDASDDGPHRQIYCDTLYYSYDELKGVFGEPKRLGDDGEHWRYTWILKYNKMVYSIYDWSETYIFEDISKCEWHIGSESGEWVDIKKYIYTKLGNKELNADEFDNIN
jgi:hypothetical protein